MTTIEEVVQQVELALNDTRYPPTRAELEVMRKVLITICVHSRIPRDVHPGNAAPECQKHGVFHNTLSGSMRLTEKHQRMPARAGSCRS